jgi:ribonuclease BN (tRNA processing enzyme)
MLELEILGSNATAPTREGPASCYLLHTRTGVVLVDAGPGSLLAYCSRYELGRLRAIVVTHMHADHSLDLMAWAYRWTFPEVLPRIPLFLPEGETDRLAAFDAVFGIPTLAAMNQPIAQSFEVTTMPRDGRSVHEARREMGRRLAREAPVDADMVIPVPDTGHSAAQGFAQAYTTFRRQQAQEQFQTQARPIQVQIAGVKGEIADIKGQIAQTEDPEEQNSLSEQLTPLLVRLGTLQQQLEDLRTLTASQSSGGEVVQPANLPTAPASPDPTTRTPPSGNWPGLR